MAQTKGETFKSVIKDLDSSNQNVTQLRFGGMQTKSEERKSVQTPSSQYRTTMTRDLPKLRPSHYSKDAYGTNRPTSPANLTSNSSLMPWLDAQLKKTGVNKHEKNWSCNGTRVNSPSTNN
jgi:hypothetical protein